MAVALPMESNPDVMNKYLSKLGVSDKWRMVDVIGLEEEALSWVPRPVLAVILLFPLSDAYEQHRCEQEGELIKKGVQPPSKVFHVKQVQSNICGIIALVHSIANNTHLVKVNHGLLLNYIKEAANLDSSAKGELLESSEAIFKAYKDVVHAEGADSEEVNETPNNHFVTFIHDDGHLLELDGRKSAPIDHGPTTPEHFLEDAAKICRQFIEREPDSIGFNIVALVPAA